MASKNLTSTELANIIAMLSGTGAAPIPRASGFGSDFGATRGELLSRLRQDLGADLFGGSAYGPAPSGAEVEALAGDLKKASAKAAGRGETIRRLGSQAGKGGLLGAASKGGKLAGLGRMALLGTGGIGAIFLAMDIMNLLGGKDDSQKRARASASSEFLENMETMAAPRGRDLLSASNMARRMAQTDSRQRMPMSPELRDLLASDPTQVFRYRQQMKPPSLQEAYARAGLTT